MGKNSLDNRNKCLIKAFPVHYNNPQSEDFLPCESSRFSSEGRDPDYILQASFALFQRQITVTQLDLHFVPLGKHLADLQESLALCLWDHQPDVDQRDQADEGKDDEAVGTQTFLEEGRGRGNYDQWKFCRTGAKVRGSMNLCSSLVAASHTNVSFLVFGLKI